MPPCTGSRASCSTSPSVEHEHARGPDPAILDYLITLFDQTSYAGPYPHTQDPLVALSATRALLARWIFSRCHIIPPLWDYWHGMWRWLQGEGVKTDYLRSWWDTGKKSAPVGETPSQVQAWRTVDRVGAFMSLIYDQSQDEVLLTMHCIAAAETQMSRRVTALLVDDAGPGARGTQASPALVETAFLQVFPFSPPFHDPGCADCKICRTRL